MIIDYVESSECPPIGGERYNAASTVRHAGYPRDAEIVVCADQRVPKGWRRQGRVDDPENHDVCPSSRVERPISERVMRIRNR